MRALLPPVFYGWWIVAAAFILHGLSGGLFFHAFGAYFVYLQAEFGWSRTLIAGAFSLSRLESGFLGPLQGWLINRFGSRAVVQVGLLLFGLGLILFTRIDSAPTLYGAFFVIALGSGLCGFLTLNIALMNWFEKKRSTAIAISATGSSVAGLMVPVVAWALGSFGWRATALGSGILVLLIGLPVAHVIRQTPEAYGYVPDGARAADSERDLHGRVASPSAPTEGFAAREALHTRAFWLLALGHGLALMSVSAIAAHLIPFLVTQLDMAIEAAAGVVALLTGVSLVTHLVGGFVGDRVDRRLLATLCMAGHTVALLVLASAMTPLAAAAFAAIQGLAWGFRGPLMTPIRADYFGRRALATLEGFAALVTTAGLTIGPIAAGFIADTIGDYRPGFLFVAAMTAIGILCFGLATRPNRLAPAEPTGSSGPGASPSGSETAV